MHNRGDFWGPVSKSYIPKGVGVLCPTVVRARSEYRMSARRVHRSDPLSHGNSRKLPRRYQMGSQWSGMATLVPDETKPEMVLDPLKQTREVARDTVKNCSLVGKLAG